MFQWRDALVNVKPDTRQRWLTFVRNHAQAIVVSDFMVVGTARFRILNVAASRTAS